MRISSKRMATLAAVVLLSAAPALSNGDPNFSCSIRTIAGRWMFATDVGQQMLFPGIDGDITAIGTMNINTEGKVSGVFDATVAAFAFLPNNTYTGSVAVDRDCRGTLSFVTSTGSERTDSIAIVGNGSEILGMSQDFLNLWTYKVKRISGRR